MLIEKLDILPQEAFLLLRGLKNPFILMGPPQRRYSFVGADPFMSITTDRGGTSIAGEGESGDEEIFEDPFTALSKVMAAFNRIERGPFPFNGGAIGYLSYDLKDIIEKAISGKGRERDDELNSIPLACMGIYDPVFVYDHTEGCGYIVSTGAGEKKRFDRIKELLNSERPRLPGLPPLGKGGQMPCLESTLAREDYLKIVRRALEYIAAGDIYQINLSQRLKFISTEDPFAVFLRLLEKSPARFSSFMDFGMDFGRFQIISNSPERLLKVEGDEAETEPIKGTRPRGKTQGEDTALVSELRNSPKEKAEHLMVVDLERNDLGRVSAAGAVEVVDFERIETYPTLLHMVSTVRARLKSGIDAPTALKACFPGGSVTGAPKIRAMEIIEELEPVKRGIYTGGLGWMDFAGDMDMAMAIRTAVCVDGAVYLSVGGGIVADSDPEEEYAETLLKAEDFLRILTGIPPWNLKNEI